MSFCDYTLRVDEEKGQNLKQIPDFLVVGAGINGLLVSRNLLALGASVMLIDQGEVARESSWAGGGIVSPLYPWRYSLAVTALANWAQEYYPQLVRELLAETGVDAEFETCGLLMLDAPDQSDAVSWAVSEGKAMEVWGAGRIYEAEQNLAADFGKGLWMPHLGHVRNPRLCKALIASLKQSPSFALQTHTRVAGFEQTDNRIVAAYTNATGSGERQSVQAGAFVLTAGAWTQQLLGSLQVESGVAPVKGQMLQYRLAEPLIDSMVLHKGKYLIPRRDRHLLVGSTLEYADFDKSLTEEGRKILQDAAVGMLPDLARYEPVRQWSGLRPGRAGGLPVIGLVEPHENLFVNAGQFRNGLVLAPASARLLSELIMNQRPFIDPQPYRPGTDPRGSSQAIQAQAS